MASQGRLEVGSSSGAQSGEQVIVTGRVAFGVAAAVDRDLRDLRGLAEKSLELGRRIEFDCTGSLAVSFIALARTA